MHVALALRQWHRLSRHHWLTRIMACGNQTSLTSASWNQWVSGRDVIKTSAHDIATHRATARSRRYLKDNLLVRCNTFCDVLVVSSLRLRTPVAFVVKRVIGRVIDDVMALLSSAAIYDAYDIYSFCPPLVMIYIRNRGSACLSLWVLASVCLS